MYDAGEYSDARELLSSQEASVEVLWRRCRLLKSFADLAKDKGDAKENERCLREGLQLVREALQRDDSNWAVHKWYAITVSLVSAFGMLPACSRELIPCPRGSRYWACVMCVCRIHRWHEGRHPAVFCGKKALRACRRAQPA